MRIKKVKALIKLGESSTLEFKTSTAKLNSIFETLCAFLNGAGGVVLIGVKDNGDIVGQAVTDNTTLEIANLISKFEPPAVIDIKYFKIENGNTVIQLTANPKAAFVPYVFDGKPFWRVGSSTRLMPQQHYHELLLEKTIHLKPWDSMTSSGLTVNDLDHKKIIEVLNKSIKRGRLESKFSTDDPTDALQTLGLISNDLITNAAGVLFCKKIDSFYPQCIMKLACFKGTTKSDILDSKQIYGNAFTLLEEAEAFLMRHMSISSEFVPGKMAREDIPEYSLRAIREAIVNAICHRDYSIHSGSVSFMIHQDRLEISSLGKLPQGISLEQLKQKHSSVPRNAKITHVMYKCGFIESVGSGTQEMIQDCRAIGSPDPEFIQDGSSFSVVFSKNLQVRDKDELTIRQREILTIMQTLGECTRVQIANKFKALISERSLRAELSYLEKTGRVLRRGIGKAITWKLT